MADQTQELKKLYKVATPMISELINFCAECGIDNPRIDIEITVAPKDDTDKQATFKFLFERTDLD